MSADVRTHGARPVTFVAERRGDGSWALQDKQGVEMDKC